MDVVNTKRPVILMVDDDEKLLAAVRRTLATSFEFVTFSDGQMALDWLSHNRERTDLVIADLIMPTLDGISFLKQAARIAPMVSRMMLSGNISTISLREAISQAMVTRVLAKPVSVSVLKDAIDRVIQTNKPAEKPTSRVTPMMVNSTIDQARFSTVLQPRFAASDLGLCGVEVLCRMPSLEKDFGVDEIFEACRDHPVINRLTSQLMAVMIDQAPRYRALLGDSSNLAVNISAYSLKTPEFLDLLIRFYEKMRMRGVVVTYEIPERQLVPDDQELLGSVSRLRERGIAVLIDDFGSGNNSLELLRHEVFAGIKLDRELVRGIMTDFLDDAFVEWIAQVCWKMGLSISAKGIESGAVVEKLQVYGITELQGFYLGSPEPLDVWEEKTATAMSA
ncbi:EAL domain-containing response regulator [Thalassospira sp. GO-4]|jgi:EAL domain-containing protein (putative c-di-GMP-specific phosphodiesterase class I)/CheY-like chemotaxis protein|uniref:EAL domain-containing response regulator n=1 Tax=Thalassospira sp. GO-4 TaxID=2946605 RepID=UPI002023FF77|nr:EAL domain-containing response regulator [Thalassospira sp. GO-4]URK16796.1 EAL domain-containing response regulator [Thalassospira sp. GO-4]